MQESRDFHFGTGLETLFVFMNGAYISNGHVLYIFRNNHKINSG